MKWAPYCLPQGGPPLGKSISYISYYICIYSIEGPQGGETAAPLFILGDFVAAFVGERSPC